MILRYFWQIMLDHRSSSSISFLRFVVFAVVSRHPGRPFSLPSGPSYYAMINGDCWLRPNPTTPDYTEPGIRACTWLREISSCSCLTVLPGPAWLLLNKICTPCKCNLTVHALSGQNALFHHPPRRRKGGTSGSGRQK